MTTHSTDATERKAARVVGLAYLLALVPAMFAEFYVFGRLIVDDSAAQTALNIVSHERLFRVGTAANLFVFALDIILITALYVVLKTVNKNLVLLAAFWGIVETTVLVVATLSDLEVLRLLSGVDYLRVFEADRLQALARLSISAHNSAYIIGLVFAGLRSAVFCYLWLKSRYVPRVLAALGLFGSLLLAARSFSVIVFPELSQLVPVEYYASPIFIFELTMGFWLLLKGINSRAKG
ncbi:MAG TPA: DUF4386 domain-containing protein [Pyrinomonadaceae bacterium]|nr:DUF4386 domain-containing protein [Pyrinomonadaceae bacterium]